MRYREGKITNKLARGSLKANTRRNIFAVVTIALSTCMVMAVAMYLFGVTKQAKRNIIGRHQASFFKVEPATITKIGQHEDLESMGITYYFDSVQENDYKLMPMYVDETLLELAKIQSIEGGLPKAQNEIAIGTDYLNHTGKTLGAGDTLTMDIGQGVEEYIVSGVFELKNTSKNFSIYTSKALVEATNEAPLYSVYFRIKGGDEWEEEYLVGAIEDLASDVGIRRENIVKSSYYIYLMKQGSISQMIMTIGLCLVVALASILVIYNLFYISVIAKINEYGRLKILGATEKQIRKIVYREGKILSAVAIPLGLVLGAIIGYILIPGGWSFSSAIIAAAVIGTIIYISVMLAMKKPTGMASKVTPVEAMRHISSDTSKRKAGEKKYHRITPARLSIINASRNKKKTALTLCSLGVCGVLLMAGSVFLNSVDYEDMARKDYPDGEILVQLGAGKPSDFLPAEFLALQNKKFFTDQLIQDVSDIEGVTYTKMYSGIVVTVDYPSGTSSITDHCVIDGYTEDELDIFEEAFLEGTVDPKALLEGNGIIVGVPEAWNTVYGWTPALGDILSFRDAKGNQTNLTVMGIVSDTIASGGKGKLYVPLEVLSQIESGISDYQYEICVKVEKGKIEQVENEIQALIADNYDLGTITLKDGASEYRVQMEEMKAPIYILIGFIGVFGIINLLNTLITNILVRKQELGTLQALGLENRQFKEMLLLEGLLYSLATILITLTLGSVCGYVLCRMLSGTGMFGTLSFNFPIVQICLYFAAVLIVQIATSLLSVRTFQKQTLVERMRSYA